MNEGVRQRHGAVLIVGAGSSGMVAALELGRQGVKAVLVDAADGPCLESRGTGLQPRTLELLDLYGLSDQLWEVGNRIRSFITLRSGKEISRIDFWRAHSRFNASPALPQSGTEGLLRGKLAEQGVEILWRHELIGVDQDGEQAVARLNSPDGPIDFAADWIIGADGARSTMRRLIGLQFEGVSYPEVWGLLDVTLEWDLAPDEVRVYRLDGAQQFVVVPLGGTNYRLQLDNRPADLAGVAPTLEEMRDAFSRFTGQPGTISNATWASAFNIHRRQVVTYRNNRVLLAGDAAHIHTPAGAQGLNTGIQDGINLGWKLGLVVKGQAGAELLNSYEAERKPIAAGVLELSEALARRPDALVQDSGVAPDLLANRVGQLLVSYRDGPLGQPVRGPQALGAGDRLPDVELNGASIYRALRPGRIVVALFADEEIAATADALADLYPAIEIWRMRRGDNLARAVGLVTGALVIRPDAYLGLVVEGDVQAAVAEVSEWLRRALCLNHEIDSDIADLIYEAI